jgi:hypothetical protein
MKYVQLMIVVEAYHYNREGVTLSRGDDFANKGYFALPRKFEPKMASTKSITSMRLINPIL